MRAPQVLLILSTLLVLALLGWFALQGTEADAEHDPALARERPIESLRPGEAAQLPKSETAPAKREAALAEPAPSNAAAGAKSPKSELRSDRTVAGRVVDEFGAAVVDARVFMAPSQSFGGDKLDLIPESSSMFQVERTKSDSSGAFSFDSNLRGELRFAVRAPGYAPLRVTRRAEGGDRASVDDFVLERSALLSGHVVDAAGNGVEGVAIQSLEAGDGAGMTILFSGDASDPLATTGPGGVFEIDELAAGPFKLGLTCEDHPDLTVTGNVDRPGQVLADLRYVLEDGFTIAGRVRGLEAGQAGRFQVRALPNGEVTMISFSDSGGMRLADVSADGAFELRGLREGQFRLNAIEADGDLPLFSTAQSAAVVAKTGDRNVELQLRPPCGLTLRVLDDSNGESITRYRIEAGRAFLQGLRSAGGEERDEHPEGVATIPDVPLEVGQTSTRVIVTAEGYETMNLSDVQLTPGSVVDLGDLRMKPVPMITVTVLDDATGEPVHGARVNLSEVEAPMEAGARRVAMSFNSDDAEGDSPDFLGLESHYARTDEAGVAKVASFPGKPCQLKVTQRTFADYVSETLKLSNTSEREIVVRLLKGGTVIVLVLDAQGNPKVGAAVEQQFLGDEGALQMGSRGGNSKSDSDGRVEFTNLRAGTHNFKLKKSGGSGVFASGGGSFALAGFEAEGGEPGEDVLVSEGSLSEITLRAQPEGEVTGRITERGQPLASATLTFEKKSKEDPSARSGMRRGMPAMFGGGGETARSDSQGKYSREGLEVGDYTVTITHANRSMPAEFELHVNEGKTTQNYDLQVAILEGRVKDSDGEPVAGVTVTPKRFEEGAGDRPVAMRMIMTTGGGGGMAMSFGDEPDVAARTDAEGRYSLRGVTPNVELIVESSADDYQKAQSKPVTVGENQTRRDCDIDVFEAGSVLVSALDAAGEPVSFCTLRLDYEGDEEPAPEPARSFIGEGGQAKLGSLRPGPWKISAQTVSMMGGNGGGDDSRKALPTTVDVVAGEQVEVTVRFE